MAYRRHPSSVVVFRVLLVTILAEVAGSAPTTRSRASWLTWRTQAQRLPAFLPAASLAFASSTVRPPSATGSARPRPTSSEASPKSTSPQRGRS